MKVRINYVSNSSSSSYIVVGKKKGSIHECKKEDLDFNNNNYVYK